MKEKNVKPYDRYTVPAVEQAARLLFCLAETESSRMSLTEICAKVGIHKSKGFSILHTLRRFGLVQRDLEGKKYSLGPGLMTLSRKVLDNFNLPRLAEPVLESLSRDVGSTATLGIISDTSVFVVAKHEVEGDVGITVRVGHRFPLTYGSQGKAIAAFLPPDELDRLLEQDYLYFHGKPERFDRTRLEEELERCRREGYAVDLGEVRAGLNAVAAPVFGLNGVPFGYIMVIGVFSAEAAREYGPRVAEAGRALSRQLGAKID